MSVKKGKPIIHIVTLELKADAKIDNVPPCPPPVTIMFLSDFEF